MSNRIKLILLIIIMSLPMPAAWIMLHFNIGIPEGNVAKGNLEHNLPRFNQWPLVTGESIEKWLLVWNAPGECADTCAAEADKWWRMHRAMGREADRLERVRLVTLSQEALPGESVRTWQTAQLPDWAMPFQVWLVDPRGLVVTAYPAQADVKDVHADIKYLLKRNPD